LRWLDQYCLISIRGLGPQATLALYRGLQRAGPQAPPVAEARPEELLRFLPRPARRSGRPRPIVWPDRDRACREAELLAARGARLLWRGDRGYPRAWPVGLGRAAPPSWVLIQGPAQRLEGPLITIVGSRHTPKRLAQAATVLARRLAEEGVAVVSGLAPGADQAAHHGAAAGAAGTVALPACGLLRVSLSPEATRAGRWTLIGLAHPAEGFNAGVALRRDRAAAALGWGLVLVAAGLRSGAFHAVNAALRLGRPLWALEDGDATPPGNAALIRSGQARPLALGRAPLTGEAWEEQFFGARDVLRALRPPDRPKPGRGAHPPS